MWRQIVSGAVVERQDVQLRFQSIFDADKVLAFPRGRSGVVGLDTFSRKLLNSFLYARVPVGREYFFPRVEAVLSEHV